MIVQKTSVFPAPRDVVFQKLQRLETLQTIAKPYAAFEPVDSAAAVWTAGGEMYINDLTRKGVHLTDFFFRWDHAEEPLFTMKEFEQQALKSGFATVKRCNYAGLDFCFKFQKAEG